MHTSSFAQYGIHLFCSKGGLKPWYLEECSSTLATTYSSGTPGQDASITTVDQDAR